MDAIWEKFHLDDLTDEENQKWKQIDNEILELELKTLMKGEKDREIIPCLLLLTCLSALSVL